MSREKRRVVIRIADFEAERSGKRKKKVCDSCGIPVATTVENCGYCRTCIMFARNEQQARMNH